MTPDQIDKHDPRATAIRTAEALTPVEPPPSAPPRVPPGWWLLPAFIFGLTIWIVATWHIADAVAAWVTQ